jgi:hypothetical protein
MPGALPRGRSRVGRDLPALLLVSQLFAPLFGFGFLLFVPVIIAAEFLATGHSSSLRQLHDQPWALLALALLAGWFLTYSHSLRSERSWFRPFVLVSALGVFASWSVAAAIGRAPFWIFPLALLVVVAPPYLYLYRKPNVVSYFRSLGTARRAAA